MYGFIHTLLSHDESSIDSLHAAGVVAMFAMIAICAYDTYKMPSNFSCIAFGTGAASIIAAVGGGRRLRDGPCGQPDGDGK
jgi:hypothetical protein